jgi:hypothetical protein
MTTLSVSAHDLCFRGGVGLFAATIDDVRSVPICLPVSDSPWPAIADSLQSMLALRDGWDGLGAESPHPAIVRTAMQLIDLFYAASWEPPGTVIATPSGTVFFSWDTNSEHIEAEVTASGQVEWFRQTRRSQAARWTQHDFSIAGLRTMQEGYALPRPAAPLRYSSLASIPSFVKP